MKGLKENLKHLAIGSAIILLGLVLSSGIGVLPSRFNLENHGSFTERARVFGNLTLRHVRAGEVLATHGPFKNLIVNAGETFLRDAWINTVELEIMKFHGLGTGATAAAEADTGCQTELTTQYNPDSTRATGSLVAQAQNVFRTVGTNTVDAAVAITEWCLLSQAATGGGTMWSRVVFTVINLASGDSLQTTYDLTVE